MRALTQKKHFSEWLKWQCALAVDLSWQQLLHKQSDSFLRFLLNSIEDSLPTPSVLKCWRQASAGDGKCPLGCNYAGSLKHILCSCEIAHRSSNEAPKSRITWGHDSILLAISVHPLEVEIGARGAINPQSWQWMCKIMGFDSNTRDRLTHAVQDAAVHCSHMIFLCRFHKVWETRPLLDTYGWYGAAEASQ